MLQTRLSRLEAHIVPPPAVRAADTRQQARLCANLHSLITGTPEPPYTGQAAADVALLADYAAQHGLVLEAVPPALPPGGIAAILTWLGQEATVPERLTLGADLAAWANAHVAAGRDPDAELARRIAPQAGTGGGGQ